MGKERRPILLVGIALAVVIVIGPVLLIRAKRQAAKPADYELTSRTATKESPQETRRVVPEAEEEEEAWWPEEFTGEAEAEATATEATAMEEQALEPSGYTIAGQVVDEAGAPVAGAEVEVHYELNYTNWNYPVAKKVTTDAQGRFQAADLPRKPLFLAAVKGDQRFYLLGFETHPRIAWFYPVRYVPGRDLVTGIQLVLRPGAVLAGKAVDAEDQPVENAVVTLQQRPGFKLEVTVDNQGAFRAAGLVPGEYELSAKADGFMPLALSEKIPSGQEDVILRLERGCPIEGRVIFADSGEVVSEAKVVARAERPGTWGSRTVEVNTATADPEGHFEMLIPLEEETSLSAYWDVYISKEKQTVHVEENDFPSPLIIELTKGGSVVGTTLEESTKQPVQGIDVVTRSSVQGYMSVPSGEEGRFIIKGLEPGNRYIWIESNDYKPVERYLRINVMPAEETSGVEIWVTRKLEVTGTVFDVEDTPIFGALVAASEVGRRSQLRLGEGTISDCDGRFTLRESYGTMTGLLVTHPQYAHKFVSLEQGEEAPGTNDFRIVLDEKGGSIAGFVRDESDQPKQHVVVSLQAVEPDMPIRQREVTLKTTITDSDGHYILTGVAEGTYLVKARISGREIVSGEVHVAKEEALTDVNLVVLAPGHIAGRVTDPEGTPIAGARINPYLVSSGRWSRSPSANTDEEGNYRLENLDEGAEYEVYVRAPGYGGRHGQYEQRRVTCSADGVDFVLTSTLGETGTVSGFVYRNSDGSPITSYRLLILTERGGVHGWKDIASDDGSFCCEEVPVGTATIYVQAPDFPGIRSEPFEVKAGEETSQTLFLDEGGTILGTVRRESDGSPVTKFTFSLVHTEKQSERRYRSGTYRNHKQESDDGSFQCEDVGPGEYTIYIATEGLADFETEPFTVEPNAQTTLDIYIPEGASLRGRVVDELERPVPEAVVEESSSLSRRRSEKGIYSQNWRTPDPPKKTSTDDVGQFVLSGLNPGKITLKVTHPDYADLEVSDVVVSEETPVEDLVLRLERGTLVHGWVKDFDGKLMSNVSVSLQGGGRNLSGRTDYRGEYRIEHVPNGTYESRLTRPEAILPRVTIENEEEREINIDFTEAGTISGSLEVPPDTDDLTFQIQLRGLDEMSNNSRSVALDSDNSYKIEGVFAGKYRLVPTIHSRSEGPHMTRSSTARRRRLQLTTSPEEIIVNVHPGEEVIKDVRITKIAERK